MQVQRLLPFSLSEVNLGKAITKKVPQFENKQFRGEYLLDSNYGRSLINYKN